MPPLGGANSDPCVLRMDTFVTGTLITPGSTCRQGDCIITSRVAVAERIPTDRQRLARADIRIAIPLRESRHLVAASQTSDRGNRGGTGGTVPKNFVLGTAAIVRPPLLITPVLLAKVVTV